jgi:hypothetical protein
LDHAGQNSAHKLVYLIPMASTEMLSYIYNHLMVGDDLAIDMHTNAFLACLYLQATTHSLESRYSRSDLVSAYDRLSALNHPVPQGPKNWWIINFSNIIARMWLRENLAVSDRLAILANMCSLRFTLKTTALRDVATGYKTCLLVLVIANLWPDIEARKRAYHGLPSFAMRLSTTEMLNTILSLWTTQIDPMEAFNEYRRTMGEQESISQPVLAFHAAVSSILDARTASNPSSDGVLE